MAMIADVWLIATTRAGVANAESDSTVMEFEIHSQGQVVKRPLGNPPGDNFTSTRADFWHFDLTEENIDDEQVTPEQLRISNPSSDGWLPSSFWVISRNRNNGFKLLLARPDWPIKWFDSNGGAGQPYSSSWPLNEE